MARGEEGVKPGSKIVGAGDALGALGMARRSDDAGPWRVGVQARERLDVSEAELQCDGGAGRKVKGIMSGHFRSHEIGIDGEFVALHKVFVEGVFDVRAAVLAVEETDVICLVLREEHAGIAGAQEPAFAVLPVL